MLARDLLAHSLMYLTRGQPVVYYGDEQGFIGDGGDKDARQDMFPSQVASYNDDDLIGTDATTADANFDTNHPVYQHLAELSRLRSEHPALADGAQIHRYASGNAGVYTFSRIDADDEREYLVATNNSETDQTVTFDTFSERGRFRGLWPAGTADIRSDSEGRVTVTVPALSAVVWRATSDLKHQKHAPAMYFRTPGPGDIVGGRAEVGVSVPMGGFNEVTLAWRLAGTDAWTALGTDDNTPYRVFHDVTGLAKGTLVEYRAVLRDHSGNLSVAQTYATVGDPPPPGGGGGGGGGGPVTQPTAVSVPGTANDEMGCPGEWQPECDEAQLTLDPDDQIWKGTYDLPAGDYFFKVAIDRAWTENYGAGAVPGGADIAFTHLGGPVTFYYDHGTHWVTNDVLSEIITAPGSAQSELGCPADWSPDCMRPWLQDPDGDGTWTWSTTEIPAGSYETKVTHGLSWDENYGAGGLPGDAGANIPYVVPPGSRVTFSYVLATHVLTVTTSSAAALPDLDTPRRALARARPPCVGPPGGRERLELPAARRPDRWAGRRRGGDPRGRLVPADPRPEGLPADEREQWPHLAAYRRAPAVAPRRPRRGRAADRSARDRGLRRPRTHRRRHRRADPGRPRRRLRRRLRPRSRGHVARTHAQAGGVGTDGQGRRPARPRGRGDDDTLVEMRRDDDGVWSVTGRRDWNGASYLFEVDVYVPAPRTRSSPTSSPTRTRWR